MRPISWFRLKPLWVVLNVTLCHSSTLSFRPFFTDRLSHFLLLTYPECTPRPIHGQLLMPILPSRQERSFIGRHVLVFLSLALFINSILLVIPIQCFSEVSYLLFNAPGISFLLSVMKSIDRAPVECCRLRTCTSHSAAIYKGKRLFFYTLLFHLLIGSLGTIAALCISVLYFYPYLAVLSARRKRFSCLNSYH